MDTNAPLSRRAFVRLASGTAAGAAFLPGLGHAAPASRTPSQGAGPFYPLADQLDAHDPAFWDNDLTRVAGAPLAARGASLVVVGRVLDEAGRPQPGALVELWQACTSGRYLSSKDHRDQREHDPGFQYFGSCLADRNGLYSFKTIVPPSYPSGVIPGWIRPPHLHFRVRRQGMPDFITQMYFDDPMDPANQQVNRRLQRWDLVMGTVRPKKRPLIVRSVRRGAPDSERVASLTDLLRGVDDDPPWAAMSAGQWIDFPLILDADLYQE